MATYVPGRITPSKPKPKLPPKNPFPYARKPPKPYVVPPGVPAGWPFLDKSQSFEPGASPSKPKKKLGPLAEKAKDDGETKEFVSDPVLEQVTQAKFDEEEHARKEKRKEVQRQKFFVNEEGIIQLDITTSAWFKKLALEMEDMQQKLKDEKFLSDRLVKELKEANEKIAKLMEISAMLGGVLNA